MQTVYQMSDENYFIVNKEKSMVKCIGTLDHTTHKEFYSSIDEVVSDRVMPQENSTVYLECSGLDLGASAIGIIIDKHKKLKDNGFKLSIVNPNARVYELLQVCGIHQVMEIYYTPETHREPIGYNY